MRAESLSRAVSGQSLSNYPAIFEGFMAKGVPESEIKPRENVFTFNAWIALGRVVRKGEHGVKVFTFVEMSSKTRDDKTGEDRKSSFRRPRATTVFHISQTEPLEMAKAA
jgi:antirestriction protein ArdC